MDEVAAAADEPRHDAVLISEAVGAALLGAGPGLAGAARLAVALLRPARTTTRQSVKTQDTTTEGDTPSCGSCFKGRGQAAGSGDGYGGGGGIAHME